MKIKILLAALILIGGNGLFAPIRANAQDAGRETITNKLNQIRFEVFGPIDGLPLSEVVKNLATEAKQHDPEKKGINFLINPNVATVAPASGPPVLDPTTGLPIPAPEPVEQLDMNSVLVRIAMPLNDIRLLDALDAVVLTADHPIEYAIESYGVIFSAKAPKGLAPPPESKDAKPSSPDVDQFPPVVIKTVPETGRMNVPVGVCEIRVTFSKEMADNSWSVVPAWPAEPQSPSEIRYLPDHKTCLMRVTLQPGRGYAWWLNSQDFHGFQDPRHHAAVPYLLAFATSSQMGEAAPTSDTTTDSSSQLTETWSPTLAPGEKPDVQKIRDEIKDLMDQHRYEEALQRQLWYYHHALEYGESAAVRTSFGIMNWDELGRRYPKAREALVAIRDQEVAEFKQGRGYAELFSEIQSLNRTLRDDEATYTLFQSFRDQDPDLAQHCYFYVEEALVGRAEYQWCYEHMGSVASRYDSIRRGYDMQMANQARMAQAQERSRQMIDEMNRKNGLTNLPPYPPLDNSAMLKRSAEDRFVGQVRLLIEILVGSNHSTDAEKIRDQALAVLDDARLKSAVDDAKERVQKLSAQNHHP